jgi:hypothetical protein
MMNDELHCDPSPPYQPLARVLLPEQQFGGASLDSHHAFVVTPHRLHSPHLHFPNAFCVEKGEISAGSGSSHHHTHSHRTTHAHINTPPRAHKPLNTHVHSAHHILARKCALSKHTHILTTCSSDFTPILTSLFTLAHHNNAHSFCALASSVFLLLVEQDKALSMHTDDSEITLNISLNQDFEGCNLRFCGLNQTMVSGDCGGHLAVVGCLLLSPGLLALLQGLMAFVSLFSGVHTYTHWLS